MSTPARPATKRSQVSVALEGSAFGIDFNPTVDRLRIVSDTGQNLRVNVDSGAALVDGALSYTAPPATPVTASDIIGAAYTNNDGDASTATTLFDIDAGLDQVAIQAPPNAGGLNATGKLGIDVGGRGDVDIHSTSPLRRHGGRASTLAALDGRRGSQQPPWTCSPEEGPARSSPAPRWWASPSR